MAHTKARTAPVLEAPRPPYAGSQLPATPRPPEEWARIVAEGLLRGEELRRIELAGLDADGAHVWWRLGGRCWPPAGPCEEAVARGEAVEAKGQKGGAVTVYLAARRGNQQ